ncbi:hypothetical protein R3W88_024553 [Solanum pinnatisectum]|uniref:Uncharacterized protein n=1 Tax=Solanum pinnatisectum TaxID=50273 RepID=A0AAV9M3N0_9SOLN|nr:hypothetical protein R3W88_024553 [Solanum pinnatisectum]
MTCMKRKESSIDGIHVRTENDDQHDYFISRVKELTNIFKEMTYNIDFYTSKKISQPLSKAKEKQKEKQNEKKKEKNKEKKGVRCDAKQQYPFEGFNITGEGPTELRSSFSQWINDGLYKHHAKKRDKDDHYLVNCSKLGFKQLDFVVAFPKKKDWFYVMSQPNRCWTDEVNSCPLMF